MIVPFRNGTAAVLKYASFRDIPELLREWAECDFIVFARDGEQHDRLMRAGHRNHAESASQSPCIAGRSRAGVRAEGGGA